MSIANPIARSVRRQDLVAADGQIVFGPLQFQIYDPLDLRISRLNADGVTAIPSGYTVSVPSRPGFPTVTFNAGRTAGESLRFEGARIHERTLDVTQGGVVRTAALEEELDKQTVVLQELRRDVDGAYDTIADAEGRFDEALHDAFAARDAAAASAAQAKTYADGVTVAAAIQFHSIGLFEVPVAPADATASFQIAATASEGTDLFLPVGVTILISHVALPNNIRIMGGGKIKRIDGAVGNAFITASSPTPTGIRIDKDIWIDGNKANQSFGNEADNIYLTGFADCHIDCKTINAFGGKGLFLVNGIDADGTRSSVDATASLNDGGGVWTFKSPYIDYGHVVTFGNGEIGLHVNDYDAVPAGGSCRETTIKNCMSFWNASIGIAIGNFKSDENAEGAPIYGYDGTCAYDCFVTDNIAGWNGGYNFAFMGKRGCFNRNSSTNGRDISNATGFLINASEANCDHNYSHYDGFYGLDAGASKECTFNGWNVSQPFAIGMNLGATIDCTCDGLRLSSNENIRAVTLPGIEGDGNSPFPLRGKRTRVRGATIWLWHASAQGVVVSGGYENAIVEDCTVIGYATPMNAFRFDSLVHQRSNRVFNASGGSYVTEVASAAKLIIPDGGEHFRVTGSTNISDLRSRAREANAGRANDVRMTNEGGGYKRSDPPAVVFTGTADDLPVATAEITNEGKIVGVNWSFGGTNVSPGLTVAFVGGAGAGATAVVDLGVNDAEGREIELTFAGVLTLSNGGDLILPGPLATTANTVLRLRGKGGQWVPISWNGM